MTEAKHTLGPWTTGGYNIKANNGNLLVAKLYRLQQPEDPESDANARLIAAAPDLLASLKEVAYELSTIRNRRLTIGETAALDMARAAIAKAERAPSPHDEQVP